MRRVSELVFIRGKPKAILHWIDIAGVRTPIYVDLEPSRLKRTPNAHGTTYRYDGTTIDPADVEVVRATPPG